MSPSDKIIITSANEEAGEGNQSTSFRKLRGEDSPGKTACKRDVILRSSSLFRAEERLFVVKRAKGAIRWDCPVEYYKRKLLTIVYRMFVFVFFPEP